MDPKAKTIKKGSKSKIIGQTIGGCKIQKKLGQGGMGVVFLAHHIALDIPVAVKILPPNTAQKDNVDRFVREARSAAKLKHQNIVGVLNVGKDKGLYYIIMDYVNGTSLQDHLDNPEPMTIKESTRIITKVC